MTAFGALQGRCKMVAVALVALVAVLAFGAIPAAANEFPGRNWRLLRLAVSARNADGTPDLQAGSHPSALVTTFVSNAEGDIKDVRLELPPGFVGDPKAVPQCPYQVFINQGFGKPSCSNETAVGFATTFVESREEGPTNLGVTTDPIYNLVPPAGDVAEFGYRVAGKVPVFLQSTVRSGTDYGLDVTSPNISQVIDYCSQQGQDLGRARRIEPQSLARNVLAGSA